MNSTKTIEDTSRHLKSYTYNNTIIIGSGVNKEQDSVNNSTSLDVEGNDNSIKAILSILP